MIYKKNAVVVFKLSPVQCYQYPIKRIFKGENLIVLNKTKHDYDMVLQIAMFFKNRIEYGLAMTLSTRKMLNQLKEICGLLISVIGKKTRQL